MAVSRTGMCGPRISKFIIEIIGNGEVIGPGDFTFEIVTAQPHK